MDLNSVKWHAAVHGIAKSQTQLSNQTTTEWADTLPLYLRTRWSPSRLFYPRKTFWTKLKISCDWGWGSWNLWPRTIGGSLLSEAAVNPAKLLRGPGSSVGGSITEQGKASLHKACWGCQRATMGMASVCSTREGERLQGIQDWGQPSASTSSQPSWVSSDAHQGHSPVALGPSDTWAQSPGHWGGIRQP